MLKSISVPICLAAVLTAVPSQAQTQEEIENLADAAGSAAADFEACGRSSMARRIKGRFESLAAICASGNAGEDAALNAFSLGYSNRLNDISDQGGTCRGNYQSRFDVIMDGLRRAYKSC
ncbi:hypothetical protein [Mesorhizobium sp.]|uniref:hypothetical protein n=1 Tax=Mesorhizobium sp. TaxID=1871066 RepID=UPI000FEA6994|nr:hypothetical protein [Mesorhizobium sp.]RWB65444.1 MAG: hypothetical protein EOQ49_32105 [Mesorhizobium sp.]